MFRKKLSILILGLLPLQSISGEAGGAWLEVSRVNGLVQIQVFSNLEKGVGGQYRLETVKIGPSGTSVNRQAGTFPSSTGEKVGPISTSRISLESDATLDIALRVEDDNGRVFEEDYTINKNVSEVER